MGSECFTNLGASGKIVWVKDPASHNLSVLEEK